MSERQPVRSSKTQSSLPDRRDIVPDAEGEPGYESERSGHLDGREDGGQPNAIVVDRLDRMPELPRAIQCQCRAIIVSHEKDVRRQLQQVWLIKFGNRVSDA